MASYGQVSNRNDDGDVEMRAKSKLTDVVTDVDVSMAASHGSDMKRVILCYFGILGFVCLGILYGSLLGIVVGTNVGLQNDIESDLNTQMREQAYATLDEAGDYLTRVLHGYDQTICNMTSFSTSNVLRDDFYRPKGAIQGYFDMEAGDSGLLGPTSTNARFPNEKVSTGASAAYVTGDSYTMSNKASWYVGDVKKYLDATTYLDPLFIHQWNTNLAVVQIYLGFDTNPAALRRYPGRPAKYDAAQTPTTEDDDYDPTKRDWYKAAIASNPNSIYTEPYPDFHKLGWMITGAKALYAYDRSGSAGVGYTAPTAASTPIGVMGIDVLISDIAEVLNKITFLKTGKLTLFTGVDGQVVTDSEWNPEPTDENAFYYSDLKKPKVSKTTWDRIKEVPAGKQVEIVVEPEDETAQTVTSTSKGESDDIDRENKQLIFVKHLADYGAQYYLVVFVDNKEIMAPVQPSIDEMHAANRVVSIVLVCSLFASMLLLLGLMVLLINSIVKVFNNLQENVEQLLRNVGTGRGLGTGMVEVNEYASQELQQLQESMNHLVHDLSHAGKVGVVNAGSQDVHGKSQLQALWNMVPMTETVGQDAPPMADAYLYEAPPAYDDISTRN